jgi:hypothetical protein
MDAELVAILTALRHVSKNQCDNIKNILICSDSLSSLQAIKAYKPNKLHDLLYEVTYELDQLKLKNITPTIVWIPSHIGIMGNELADYAAKNSLTSLTNQLIDIPTTAKQIYSEIRLQALEEWQTIYTQNNKIAKHHRQLEPTVSFSLKHDGPRRHIETIKTRLRTGHCLTAVTINRHQPSHDPNCRHCHVPENLQHFLSCPSNGVMEGILEADPMLVLADPTLLTTVANNIIKLKIKI